MQENELFQNTEEIVNWTYPGTVLYYKDCDLKPAVQEQFTKDKILRNGYFLDVSWKGAGMKFNTRFLIASNKAAKLYEVNPANERFGHCCINANSYFKVLDIYRIGDKTQIFLLHIPAKGVPYFRQVQSNLDEIIIEKARKSFDEKINMQPLLDLLDKFWVERTNFPVGMDGYNKFYPLDSITPLPPGGEPLFNGIRSLTKDSSELNVPEPIPGLKSGEMKKGGFLGKLFGK